MVENRGNSYVLSIIFENFLERRNYAAGFTN